jgi:PIN domain nuclease of toxin-antitoxin system
MTLLLDTHVFLWWVNGEPIPPRATSLLAAREQEVLFSAASAWEMTIKASIGKLTLPEPVAAFVQKNLARNRFRWLPVEPAALAVLQDLEFNHRDPFDRLLIAQAIALGCPLLSADPLFSAYPVECIWK